MHSESLDKLKKLGGYIPLSAYLAAELALLNGAQVGSCWVDPRHQDCTVDIWNLRDDSIRSLRKAGWNVIKPDTPTFSAWAQWPNNRLPF
jgi:hypothetical protein